MGIWGTSLVLSCFLHSTGSSTCLLVLVPALQLLILWLLGGSCEETFLRMSFCSPHTVFSRRV